MDFREIRREEQREYYNKVNGIGAKNARDLQSFWVNNWFRFSCLVEMDKKVTLKELYDHYLNFCERSRVQETSKKMFSILLKENLTDDILNGSIKVSVGGKVTFKGICIKSDKLFDK